MATPTTRRGLPLSRPVASRERTSAESWIRRHAGLGVIAVAFAVVGTLYSVSIPIFEVLGEPIHVWRIVRMRGNLDTPHLDAFAALWPDQTPEPPLYYWIGSALTRLLPSNRGDADLLPNPFLAIAQPSTLDNKNAVLRADVGGDPAFGRLVYALRLFSVFCSTLTVICTYRMTRVVIPRWPSVAFGSVAALALNPQFVFLSAGATNDALGIAFIAASLLVAVQAAHGERLGGYSSALALGLVTGLGALAKHTALAALALVPCVFAVRFKRQPDRALWRDLILPLLLSTAIAGLIAGWWYARPGALSFLTSFDAFNKASSAGAWPFLALQRARLAFMSYWGLFGWLNVPADSVYYTALLVLCVLSAMGLVLRLARTYWRERRVRLPERRPSLLLAIWALAILALIAWGALSQGERFGLSLLAAIPVTSFFFFIGLSSLVARRDVGALAGLIAALLAAVVAAVPARFIVPVYERPITYRMETLPEDIHALDVDYGGELFLLGYSLVDADVSPGQEILVRLWFVGRKRMVIDHVLSVTLHDWQGSPIGAALTHGGGGSYPTSLWLPGEVIQEEVTLAVSPDVAAPMAAFLRVSVQSGASAMYLEAHDAGGGSLGQYAEIGPFRIAQATPERYEPEHVLDASFDGRIALIGYDQEDAAHPAGEAEIVLYWRGMGTIGRNYTVFLHLVDASGRIAAQTDEEPLGGQYPTSLWQPDETIRDPHGLNLPASLAEGPYHLVVGLYMPETGRRLDLVGTGAPANSVRLGEL